MAPTPDPTPTLSLTPHVQAGLITPSPVDQFLGKNITIVNSNDGGFQTTLPMTTSNLMFSKGIRILPGSTYNYFTADNFEIDNTGKITSKSTATNTLAGGLTTAGLLTANGGVSTTSLTATTGDITASTGNFTASVGGFTAKTGFTAQTGDFSATTGKFTGKGLQITSTNLNIDSVAGSLNLVGSIDMKNSAATFALNSTSGAITTFGHISTSGSGTITSAGSVSGASLNVGYYAGGKKALTIDGNGAITGKDSTDATIYSVGSDGSALFKGTLQANGDVKFGATQQVTIASASGNFATPGTITSGAITSSGNATISGNVNIGTSILLSNSTTSTFANGVSVGGKNTFGSNGSASLAAGNFAVAATGDLVSKGTASFGNNAVTLGTASLTNAKLSVDSAGNVAASGTLSVAGNVDVAGNVTVNTDKFVVTAASGNVSAGGTMSVANDFKVATDKFVVTAASGNVSAKGTLSAIGDLAINSNKFNVAAASGNVTAAGTMGVAGDLAINSNKFNVAAATGNVTAAGTMGVASDFKVATDKFVVTAASGNVAAKGTGTFVGDLKVLNADGTTNFEINSSDATANASFANGYVKITSAGAVVDSIAYSQYVPSASVTNTTTTGPLPALGTAEDIALFGSTTKNWLTTQEYVDRSIFQTTKRLNYLVGSDVSYITQRLDNYINVLAEIDGSSSAAIIKGLQGDYSMLNVTVDSIIASSYNSILINCVPAVWGDECPPLPMPNPVTQFYQGDGWYFSNIGDTNKINWYFPVFSNMKVSDIQNLFISLYAVSSKEMPSIVVYTKPKNNTSDLFTALANASIVYKLGVPNDSKSLIALKQYAMYTNTAPSNLYIDSDNEVQALRSVTTNGTKSMVKDFTTTPPSSFSATYDTTIVSPTDNIAFFGLITTGLEAIKEVNFVLQSFNVSLKTGTTQMLLQNRDVVNNYLMNYLFKKNSDFSNYLDNPPGYMDSFVKQVYAKNLVNLPTALGKPDVLDTKLLLFKVNDTDITTSPATITLPSSTTSTTQIPVKIVAASSLDNISVYLNNVKVGESVTSLFDRTITGLTVGDNELRVVVFTTGNNVTTTRLVFLRVVSADATINSFAWSDSANNSGYLDNSLTTQEVSITQGATSFSINASTNNLNATISAKVAGVNTTWTSSGIQISITPGQTINVEIIVTAQNGTTSSHIVIVVSPAPDNTPVSSGYASLDALLNTNDLTLSSGSSIMTSNTNGTTQNFGFAFSKANYTLQSGPTSTLTFTGAKVYIVASYNGGLNWSLLKYSNPNDTNYSFVSSTDTSINSRTPSNFSIVYNNNENTVLSLNAGTYNYYLIFNRTDPYFSRSLINSRESNSTSAANFTKSTSSFLSSYYNVLYLSAVPDSTGIYDYYAIVLNTSGVGYNIFIMARQVGSTSSLKTLSIVVQYSPDYIFADNPTISKVTDNGVECLQVQTSGNEAFPNFVPQGTYRTSIPSLTNTMTNQKYTTSTNNVVTIQRV